MNRNYNSPDVAPEWAETRETHLAVATAIHAISSGSRTPETIWEAPTQAERDHITMAVAEYVAHGDFPAEPDGRYPWGQESVSI